jgi:adenylate cyclase
LAEFASVVDAMRCAVGIQQELRVRNAELPDQRKMEFRIGINLGDVVTEGERLYGDGVNIAARVESLADPGGICVSATVYEHVENKLPLTYESLGEQTVKNIAKPVRVWRVVMDAAAAALVEQTKLPQAQPEREQASITLNESKGGQARRAGAAYRPWVLGGAVGLLLIGGTLVAIFYLSHWSLTTPYSAPVTEDVQPPSLPLPDKASIIVLPFVNMSGDPEQEYFGDGLTEVLTGDLSQIPSLFVIARNSAFTYKGQAVKIQQVGREMGVRYVLEGSVLKANDQVRITAQLIDASTGYHLWSERYDRPLQDLFRLQDEIVQRIVTTLKLQLTLQEQGLRVRKRTDNLEAYDAFLRGMEYAWRFTKDATVQARQLWEKAIALDPQYAEAYAALGASYYLEWIWHWNTDPQTLARALALGQQAVALDDSLPLAHSVLSWVYAQRQQFDQAIAEGQRAIALDPNNADVYVALAEALFFVGRPDEMSKLVEQAMRLNPRYPPTYLEELGWGYCLTGRYTEAVATLKEAISRSPAHLGAHVGLASSYVQQWAYQQGADAQTLEQALEIAHRIIALNDFLPPGHQILGTVYLLQKQYEPAMAEMEKALALDPNNANGYALLAEVLSRLGRSQEALGAAEKALGLKPYLPDQHLLNVGAAYALAGRLEETIAPLQRYLSRYPNTLGAHLGLAAIYSGLGKEAEARAEAAEVLRLNPNFSLEVHRQRAPIKDLATLELHIAVLRKAGLK